MASRSKKIGRKSGNFQETVIGSEKVRAFVPLPLPPTPPLDTSSFFELYDQATAALGRLDGAATALPSTPLFLFMYVRKEALLSSQIEGTQSSLSELLLFETEQNFVVPLDDVTEVSNYVAALEHGLRRIREGFPLSLRLLREIHKILLRSGRGTSKQPGEFRSSQNWIGGTRPGNALFVPPPPNLLLNCLSEFEYFLHARDNNLTTLLRAGLAHAQFETIHPFLDGNGRLGRLLITLILCEAGVIHHPVLYLSLYFKQNRSDYYRLLQEVRSAGNWEAWIEFYLSGVAETAEQATTTARKLSSLFDEDRKIVGALGRTSVSAHKLLALLQKRPLITAKSAAKELDLSLPTTGNALDLLQKVGIVSEITGKKRDRVFAYTKYLAMMDEGTEPLPR